MHSSRMTSKGVVSAVLEANGASSFGGAQSLVVRGAIKHEHMFAMRKVAGGALMFALMGGCGSVDAGSSAPFELVASETDEVRARAYTDAELDVLAASAKVKALGEPYADTPPPSESLYVTVADGTRLAISLYYPKGFDRAVAKAPVVYVETWYGRAGEAGGTAIELYNEAGFVVAIADPRGFGASFGSQPALMSEAVRRDQKDLVAWLASRPWSNGQVAAVGFSISATDADLVAASGSPSVKAAILRAEDFDHYTNNLYPGGVPNNESVDFTSFLFAWMRGDLCPDLSACSLAPVDGDLDFSLMTLAFQDHRGNVGSDAFANVTYRDDVAGGSTFDRVSAVGSVGALARAAVPARVSASWLDGTTANSALTRFAALKDVPMNVVIGATTHSGGLDADPFAREPFGEAHPPAPEQYAQDVAFVKWVLAGHPVGRSVDYYVLGANAWKSSPSWPPSGVEERTFKLSERELEPNRAGRPGERPYRVDPATSAGRYNRWSSQHNTPIFYGDRRLARGSGFSFDASAVKADMELVGAPELCLVMRTDQSDGIVIAYLEDVAPSGKVTYLTEGELRLIHRRTASGGCDAAPGTDRTFDRADARPVVPGELMEVEIPLLQTAALIRKGHHLRLSLAGADAGPRPPMEVSMNPDMSTFPAMTPTPANWSVAYGGAHGSTLTVPMRAWSRN